MAHASSRTGRRDAIRLVFVGIVVGLVIALSIPAWGQRSSAELRQDASLAVAGSAASYNVFFVRGSDQLDAAGKDIVALAAEHVRASGARRVVVIPTPDARDADALVESRAGAVLAALRRSPAAAAAAGVAVAAGDRGGLTALDPRVEIRVLP